MFGKLPVTAVNCENPLSHHHNGQSFEVRDPDGNTLVFVND